MTTATHSPITTPDHPTASRRDHLLTMAFGTWTMIGLFVDGWAHRNLDGLETFFTPWHGLFYSGFLATAGWIVWMIIRGVRLGMAPLEAVPVGYGPGVAGIALFAAGGVGDGIWHSFLGIETSIDALLSPTHIALFIGLMAVLTSPLRATIAAGGVQRPSLRTFLPALASATLATALTSFFFIYASAFISEASSVEFSPTNEGFAALGVMQILATTVIMMYPTLFLARRWVLPPGSLTILFGVTGFLMPAFTQFDPLFHAFVPLAAGVTGDLMYSYFSPPTSRRRLLWFAGAVPPAMWSIFFVATAMFSIVRWPVELWTGSIVLSSLVGLGLASAFLPPNRANMLAFDHG